MFLRLLVKVAVNGKKASLQCRRILGGRNLVRVRIVVAAIFDFMTVEWKISGTVEIVTLRVGARAKAGKGGGGGEKKFLSLSPPPLRFL